MMKNYTSFVVLLLASIALVSATKWSELEGYSFKKYTQEFNKNYASDVEYEHRRQIFEAALEQIKEHNRDPTKSWKKGVNHLTDRTQEEYEQLLGYNKQLGYALKAKRQQQESGQAVHAVFKDAPTPASIDWRDHGVVTPVKDQGRCGSCWSFGTAETIESHYAIATGKLAVLSEQQILDCVPNPHHCGGTGGCEGGVPEIAYQQIINMGGLASEWTYPYISYFGTDYSCHFNASNTMPVAQLASYVVLPSNQYDPVLKALANIGPLAVNVQANVWKDYESGVFDGCDYSNVDIDHVVQLVGYGTDSNLGDYWLIRNSWTPSWGENGYMRLKRQSTPICGTDLEPSDGTGCSGGPSQVTVCGTCGILYDVSYPIIAH